MPFKSQVQRRYLYAIKPEIAKEFATKTKNMKNLPEHKGENNLKKKPVVPKMA